MGNYYCEQEGQSDYTKIDNYLVFEKSIIINTTE